MPSYSSRVEGLTPVLDLDRAEQITDSSPFPRVRKLYMTCLYHICGHHNLAPGAKQIELVNSSASIVPCSGGGFGEAFKRTNRGLKVVIKVLKTPSDGDLRKMSPVSHS